MSANALSSRTHRNSWRVLDGRMPVCDTMLTASSIPSKGVIVVFGALLHRVFHVKLRSWIELPRMRTRRIGFGSVCFDHTVFIMGGKEVEIDDDSNDVSSAVEAVTMHDFERVEWERLPSMITERFLFATALVKDNIVVVGGRNYSDDGRPSHLQSAEIYNISDKTWKALPNTRHRRFSGAGAAVQSKMFVFGGFDHGSSLNIAESFDLTSQTWETLPTMPHHRALGTAVTVGEFILLIGGWDENGNTLDSVDCYDTVIHQWVCGIPSLHTSRRFCSAAYLEEQVFVFGGMDQEDDQLDTIETLQIDFHFLMTERFWHLFQQNDLPLGLWAHLIAGRPLDLVHSILLSERFHLDSVLQHSFEPNKKSGRKRKATSAVT